MTIIASKYVNCSLAEMRLMSLVFFGKGFAPRGWTVISDTSPKSLVGVNGGLFNLIGNLAGITTPIIIGAIIARAGTFHYALLYVAATALLAIISYLSIVGEIRRLESPRDLIAGSNP